MLRAVQRRSDERANPLRAEAIRQILSFFQEWKALEENFVLILQNPNQTSLNSASR
jgi:hypothetical protein